MRIHMYVHMSIHLSLHVSIHMSAHMSIHILCLEVSTALMRGGLLEVYTSKRHQIGTGRFGEEDRHAVGMLGNLCKADDASLALYSHRQSFFPVEAVRRIFEIRTAAAECSNADDRRKILNFIAGRDGDDFALEPFADCTAYNDVDARLHGCVAARAWRMLLEAGDDMHTCATRVAASAVPTLALSFRGCAAFTDVEARRLIDALPPTLSELRLELVESGATPKGGRAVLDGMLGRVELLPRLRVLDLSECLLSGTIPETLGQCSALEVLDLSCNQLTGTVPDALGRCTKLAMLNLQKNRLSDGLPDSLRECELEGSLQVIL